MIFIVYILYSAGIDVYYRGQTSDISGRLKRHNSGRENATKPGILWELVYTTNKVARVEASKLERKLKNLSRERTSQFIQKYKVGVAGPDDSGGMSGC